MSVPHAAVVGGGLIQDKFDPRDHYYIPDPSTQPPDHVNLRQDHTQLVSEIYTQGKTNSCTANASAAAFWYEEKAGRREQVWGVAGPSRLFIYWLARGGYTNDNHDIARPSDSGSSAREAMRGLAKIGVCSETDWPFDVSKINMKPSDDTFEKAKLHKVISFYRLDPDRPDENNHKLTREQKDKIGALLLENLRKCLAEQYPVVFGFWYYLPFKERFETTSTQYVMKDIWALPDKKFPHHTFPEDLPEALRLRDSVGNFIQPGHTVLAIGYDDTRQQVLIQNSWGPDWSGNGTFWMPYSFITDFAASNDFWTIRSTPATSDSTPKDWQAVHEEIMS